MKKLLNSAWFTWTLRGVSIFVLVFFIVGAWRGQRFQLFIELEPNAAKERVEVGMCTWGLDFGSPDAHQKRLLLFIRAEHQLKLGWYEAALADVVALEEIKPLSFIEYKILADACGLHAQRANRFYERMLNSEGARSHPGPHHMYGRFLLGAAANEKFLVGSENSKAIDAAEREFRAAIEARDALPLEVAKLFPRMAYLKDLARVLVQKGELDEAQRVVDEARMELGKLPEKTRKDRANKASALIELEALLPEELE